MRERFQEMEAGELLSLRIRSDPSATCPSDKISLIILNLKNYETIFS